MFLSIIIPVYNVEKYLPECLDSCLNQDIPSSDYEIICVDDGSPDNCSNILDSYAEKYDNIVVIHKENGGVSSARNAGIDISKGDYIWFVDSDDTIKVNSLNQLKTYVYENSIDILSFNSYTIRSADDYIDAETNPKNENIGVGIAFLCVWKHLFKKELLDITTLRFDERIIYGEDELFCIQVSRPAKKSETIDDIIYYYRIRKNSAMSNIGKKVNERIESIIISIGVMKNALEKENNILDFEKEFIRYRYGTLKSLLSRISYAEYKKFIAQLKKENLILINKKTVNPLNTLIPTYRELRRGVLMKKCRNIIRKFKKILSDLT